jgi:hypothetical protein
MFTFGSDISVRGCLGLSRSGAGWWLFRGQRCALHAVVWVLVCRRWPLDWCRGRGLWRCCGGGEGGEGLAAPAAGAGWQACCGAVGIVVLAGVPGGIAAVHTPPAATDAITDVIAGTAAGYTTYAMLPIPPAAAYLQDGGLVALGVSTARRSRLLPDVPPLTEAGVAGFDFPIWYGIWAPAQTPAGTVSTLARDIADTLATAELSEWLTQHDADPMHMSPAEFGAFVVTEAERAAVLLPAS